MLAAAGALLEIMLLRGALEMTNILSLREHRIVAIGSLLGFVAAMTVLDVAISSAVLQMGRRVEVQLRGILLEKLPRLGDSYFQRRLVSDMAHRAHTLDALRGVPDAGARFVRTSTQLLFTALALAWIDPPSAGLAVLAVTFALAIPLATGRILAERELRQRSHSAALGRHYLDSLLGLVAGRTHGAERALRHRHESLLVEWGRSSLHLLRGGVVTEGVQLLVSSLLAAWLVLGFIGRGTRPGSTLLFVYWALTLPLLARELAATMRQFPAYRNILARLLEPLRAAEDAAPSAARPPSDERAVAIDIHGVEVQVGGRAILEDVDLSITSGEHVAIVGRSGAGKSSLAWGALGLARADGRPRVCGPRAARCGAAGRFAAVHHGLGRSRGASLESIALRQSQVWRSRHFRSRALDRLSTPRSWAMSWNGFLRDCNRCLAKVAGSLRAVKVSVFVSDVRWSGIPSGWRFSTSHSAASIERDAMSSSCGRGTRGGSRRCCA